MMPGPQRSAGHRPGVKENESPAETVFGAPNVLLSSQHDST